MELLENDLPVFRRNADAAIHHVDADVGAAPAAADDHAAALGVVHRIADQVAQNLVQQPPVGMHGAGGRHMAQAQAGRARRALGFGHQPGQQRLQRDHLRLHAPRAGIQPRHVQQRFQHVVHGVQRALGAADQGRVARLQPGLRRFAQIKPRGVQRLAQIMADGGQEIRFALIGLLGHRLGFQQRGFGFLALGDFLHQPARQVGQRGGALADGAVDRYGIVEQRKGAAGRRIHFALDALDQHIVDDAQPADLVLQLGQPRRLGHCTTERPMATPVKVWFKCMAWNCSP
jgi:hypothetical protein